MKRLTIGMATFDDFEGVFFTIQALRLANLDILDDLDFIVLDNRPDSHEGKATKQFCETARVRYFEATERRSTAIRTRIFELAEAEVALSIDPHVLLEPGTIKRLIAYFEDNTTLQLVHGPMLYDQIKGHDPACRMDPVWRDNMFGTWQCDERGNDPEGDPFEIEMMGLGLFACRVDVWPGFHPLFKGFGGEEGYIHEKVRQMGGVILCLPFLRWVHRFQRPRGLSYPLVIEERIANYLIGWRELDIPPDDIIAHFGETHPNVPVADLILPQVDEALELYEQDPKKTLEAWHKDDENGKIVSFLKDDITLETWNQTDVNLGSPLKIEIDGKVLAIRSFGLSWASD